MAPPKRRRTGDKGQAASLEIRVQRFTRRFATGGVPLLPHEPAPHCVFPIWGICLVGRSPWTAADALVRLLAGRPGGRPRARAPAPHRSTERGLPESSRYPTSRFG